MPLYPLCQRPRTTKFIQPYFRMVEQDDYAGVGSILTDDGDVDDRADRLYMDRPARDRIHDRCSRRDELLIIRRTFAQVLVPRTVNSLY